MIVFNPTYIFWVLKKNTRTNQNHVYQRDDGDHISTPSDLNPSTGAGYKRLDTWVAKWSRNKHSRGEKRKYLRDFLGLVKR